MRTYGVVPGTNRFDLHHWAPGTPGHHWTREKNGLEGSWQRPPYVPVRGKKERIRSQNQKSLVLDNYPRRRHRCGEARSLCHRSVYNHLGGFSLNPGRTKLSREHE